MRRISALSRAALASAAVVSSMNARSCATATPAEATTAPPVVADTAASPTQASDAAEKESGFINKKNKKNHNRNQGTKALKSRNGGYKWKSTVTSRALSAKAHNTNASPQHRRDPQGFPSKRKEVIKKFLTTASVEQIEAGNSSQLFFWSEFMFANRSFASEKHVAYWTTLDAKLQTGTLFTGEGSLVFADVMNLYFRIARSIQIDNIKKSTPSSTSSDSSSDVEIKALKAATYKSFKALLGEYFQQQSATNSISAKEMDILLVRDDTSMDLKKEIFKALFDNAGFTHSSPATLELLFKYSKEKRRFVDEIKHSPKHIVQKALVFAKRTCQKSENDAAEAAVTAAAAAAAATAIAAEEGATTATDADGSKIFRNRQAEILKMLHFFLLEMNGDNFKNYTMSNVMGVVDLYIQLIGKNNAAFIEGTLRLGPNMTFKSYRDNLNTEISGKFGNSARKSFMSRVQAVAGVNTQELMQLLEILGKIKLSQSDINTLAIVFCDSLIRHTTLQEIERVFQILHSLQVTSGAILQALVDRVMDEAGLFKHSETLTKRTRLTFAKDALERGRQLSSAGAFKSIEERIKLVTKESSGRYLVIMTRVIRVLGHHPKIASELDLTLFLQFAAEVYAHAENLTDPQMLLIAENVHLLSRSFSPDAPMLAKLIAAVDYLANSMAIKTRLALVSPTHIDRMLEYSRLLHIRDASGMVALREARDALHIDAESDAISQYNSAISPAVKKCLYAMQTCQQLCTISQKVATGAGPATSPAVLSSLKELQHTLDHGSIYNVLTSLHILKVMQNGGKCMGPKGRDLTSVYLADADPNWMEGGVETISNDDLKSVQKLYNFKLNSSIQTVVLACINRKLQTLSHQRKGRKGIEDGESDEAQRLDRAINTAIFGSEKVTPKRVEALFWMTRMSVVRRLQDSYQLHVQLHDQVEKHCAKEMIAQSERALAGALL